MIDLFRPFVAHEAAEMVARTLAPDTEGRVYLGEGPRVQEFEAAFGSLVGAPLQPLALNSCTSALDLALHLAGVGRGDEVISTPMTCTATNGVIVNRGAKIVWADVDPTTGLINPIDVTRKVTKRTKVIMAVDWAGRSCDYAGLRLVAGHLPIIQDAAHNLMIDMANRGDYVCFSFQAIKHLTTGDGGAILVPPTQHKRARLLRWYGLDRESSTDFRCEQNVTEAGFKYHMNDIAASIGLANLPHMRWLVQTQRAHAERLSRLLAGAPRITVPSYDPTSSYWLFCLLVEDRPSFQQHMAERGIATSQVHARNDMHSAFWFPNGPLPGVEHFSEHQISVPIGWWLTDDDIEHVAGAILEWAHQHTKELAHAA